MMGDNMAKYTKAEREEALTSFHKLLKPGSTVHTLVDHVAPSGMTRWIRCFVVKGDNVRDISWMVAAAAGYNLDTRNHSGLEVGGCGMDMGFSVVYNLSRTMFPDGFRCAGKSCGSNDHSNPRHRPTEDEMVPGLAYTQQPAYVGPMPRDGRSKHRGDGGYALNQRWM
jgi:hypothetical protein